MSLRSLEGLGTFSFDLIEYVPHQSWHVCKYSEFGDRFRRSLWFNSKQNNKDYMDLYIYLFCCFSLTFFYMVAFPLVFCISIPAGVMEAWPTCFWHVLVLLSTVCSPHQDAAPGKWKYVYSFILVYSLLISEPPWSSAGASWLWPQVQDILFSFAVICGFPVVPFALVDLVYIRTASNFFGKYFKQPKNHVNDWQFRM